MVPKKFHFFDFFHGKISQLDIFFNSTSCTGLSVVLIKVRSKMHVNRFSKVIDESNINHNNDFIIMYNTSYEN